MNRMHWYTVYKAAADEVVAAGPAETVYRQLGMSSENSLYSAVSRSLLFWEPGAFCPDGDPGRAGELRPDGGGPGGGGPPESEGSGGQHLQKGRVR